MARRTLPIRSEGAVSAVHVLERVQYVPAPIERVFPFFEDPMNLERITPPWLHFEVRSTSDARVRLGTKIQYRLRWQIFPMGWRSRISEYEPGVLFADEQLRGPYRRWYHRHLFEEIEGGVRMTDRVEYQLPFGPLGRAVHRLVVRPQLEAIFDYREHSIDTLFRTE